jgi:hypothetical protein
MNAQRFRATGLRRAAAIGLTLLACLLTAPTVARAADDDEDPAAKKGYTMPYFFAGLGVLAIVIAVSRACSRKTEVEEAVADDET